MQHNINEDSNTIRLQVYVSKSGAASRREAAEIITEGRITVDGVVISEPGYRISGNEEIALDGEILHQTKNHAYVVLNKPVGYICTNKDPQGRPTAVGLVQPQFAQRLFTVGRLDFQSSGLILCTSDGSFADSVMHPSKRVEKEYLVETQQEIPAQILTEWKRGIRIAGERYILKRFSILNPRRVRVVLEEGKNREIRNVFAHFRITIRKLHRIRFGQLELGDLPSGSYRAMSKSKIIEMVFGDVSHDPQLTTDNGMPAEKSNKRKTPRKQGWAKPKGSKSRMRSNTNSKRSVTKSKKQRKHDDNRH
ncbi:pseudouridine synthase [Spirochaeta lutea]|uniref:pseudouridine synthase n=1 Tax=Spirochaeta lutea TaxID=1480694 RepID=UPI00068DE525|nr:pseudouridine synthase [Spirochaeta lutea]